MVPKATPPSTELFERASKAMVAIADREEATAIAEYLDAREAWCQSIEAAFTEFALAVARAAGISGKASGDEVIARVAELRARAEGN